MADKNSKGSLQVNNSFIEGRRIITDGTCSDYEGERCTAEKSFMPWRRRAKVKFRPPRKMGFWSKLLHRIKHFFHILWHFKIRRDVKPLQKTPVLKVTEEDIQKLSRKHGAEPGHPDEPGIEQSTPMNMVRNKKTGVVVVVPGHANTIKNYCGDKAKDYEVVESHIK
jgi:hypothetical protein